MFLSVVIINRNLDYINNYMKSISSYLDIKFIFVGNYDSYDFDLLNNNIKFLDFEL